MDWASFAWGALSVTMLFIVVLAFLVTFARLNDETHDSGDRGY